MKSSPKNKQLAMSTDHSQALETAMMEERPISNSPALGNSKTYGSFLSGKHHVQPNEEESFHQVYNIQIQEKDHGTNAVSLQPDEQPRKSFCRRLLALSLIAIVIATFIVSCISIFNYFHFLNSNHEGISTTGTVKSAGFKQRENAFDFDDMFNMEKRPRDLSFSFIGSDDATYKDRNGDIVRFSIETRETTIIMPASKVDELGIGSYTLSSNGRYMLLPYDRLSQLQFTEGIQRYNVYDLDEDELIEFPNSEVDGMKGDYLNVCRFQGATGAMTFVWRGNLYYVESPDAEPTPLTDTGSDSIRNGVGYSFVGGSGCSHSFSPDRELMAYCQFDSSSYKKFQFPWYGRYENVYGETVNQVFAKAGDPENFVDNRLFIMNMSDPSYPRFEIPPPSDFDDVDQFVWRLMWKDSQHISVAWQTRNQTYAVVEICNINTQVCERNWQEQMVDGWLESTYLQRNLDGGDAYIATMPKDEGEDVGMFRHIAIISSNYGEEGVPTFLTEGTDEVFSYLTYDTSLRVVYYYGVDEFAYTRQVFRIGTPDSDPQFQEAECVSCRLMPDCGYVTAAFSSTNKYAVLKCEGPDVPYQTIFEIDGDDSFTLENNQETREWLEEKNMPTREFKLVDVGDGFQAWGEFVFPPGFSEDGDEVYPVLLYPYAGPDFIQASQLSKIMDRPRWAWEIYLASSLNVITVRLDGRGAGGRGSRYRQALWRGLGTVEVQDQIEAARSLAGLSYVDEDKIAIWGWSYGGFVASAVLGDPSNVINCGLAIAPVTDWRYYYTGYTEKYLGMYTADGNIAGYNRSSIINQVENFRGKQFYMAHGTADDNVHLQHAAQLIRALTEAEIQFEYMMYIDENHRIPTMSAKRHMFRQMTNFMMDKCWGLASPFGRTK